MEVRNLYKTYGENRVFQNFSAIFPEGRATAIMGASGSGKTTLLRILMGLESCDSGEILGVPGKISAVFQEDRLPEGFSAVACVKMVTGRRVPDSVIEESFSSIGLEGHTDRPVRELSGGMKRRVAVVRAILADFDALFLDEALKGLDGENRGAVLRYILENTKGKTVLAVTHDLAEAEAFGNIIRL